MQFNVDQDAGTFISGWVTPDNPSAIPSIILSVPGQPDIEVPANRPRPDIRNLGHHTTGTVGFYIDEQIVPNLASLVDLSIREATSHVLLHRRSSGLSLKLFVFEISMGSAQASANIDLSGRFALAYDRIERYPFDTAFAVLNNQFAQSIYASGCPSFQRYQNVLRANN